VSANPVAVLRELWHQGVDWSKRAIGFECVLQAKDFGFRHTISHVEIICGTLHSNAVPMLVSNASPTCLCQKRRSGKDTLSRCTVPTSLSLQFRRPKAEAQTCRRNFMDMKLRPCNPSCIPAADGASALASTVAWAQ